MQRRQSPTGTLRPAPDVTQRCVGESESPRWKRFPTFEFPDARRGAGNFPMRVRLMRCADGPRVAWLTIRAAGADRAHGAIGLDEPLLRTLGEALLEVADEMARDGRMERQ